MAIKLEEDLRHSYIKVDFDRSIKLENDKVYIYLICFECEEARLEDKIRRPQIIAFVNKLAEYCKTNTLSTEELNFYQLIINDWEAIFYASALCDEQLHHRKITDVDSYLEVLYECGYQDIWWSTPIIYNDLLLFDGDLLNIHSLDPEIVYPAIKSYFNDFFNATYVDC